MRFGSNTNLSTSITESGTYTFSRGSDGTVFAFAPTTFSGTIDDLSVKQLKNRTVSYPLTTGFSTSANNPLWAHWMSSGASDSTYAFWNAGTLMTREMTKAAVNANNEWFFQKGPALNLNNYQFVKVPADGDTANLTRSKTAALTSSGKSWLNVSGIEFKNAQNAQKATTTSTGVSILTGGNITFNQCKFTGMPGYSALYTTAKPTTIKYSLFNNPNVQQAQVFANADSGVILNTTNIAGAGGFLLGSTIKDWTIKNNIYSGQTGYFGKLTSTVTIIASNNDYYGSPTNKFTINVTNYATLALYATATGQEANSITGDPRFKDSVRGDHSLDWRSPAIGTGTIIAGVTGNDIDGRPYDRKADMGAFNFWQEPSDVKKPIYAPKHIAPLYLGF
jgi:hypothetical protein